MRTALKEGLTSPLFAPAMKLGQMVRPLLPASLKNKVPAKGRRARHQWPTRAHTRKVLMLMGCVQPAMMPNINAATARVLDAAGIQTLVADDAGCCGAIRTHLNDAEGGLNDMRRNIDAWWPLVQGLTSAGTVEAIVMNASGCGVTVKEYAHHLAHDAAYAEKARAHQRADEGPVGAAADARAGVEAEAALSARSSKLAFHPPCTLQHGQQLRGGVEGGLRELGFDISVAANEATCAAARPAPTA